MYRPTHTYQRGSGAWCWYSQSVHSRSIGMGCKGCDRAVTTTLQTQPDCGGHRRVEMHRMSTNHFRDVRKGKVVHVIHPLAIAARTNASGVFKGVVLVLGPPPTNAITLAGVGHRHGETDGDWQSSGVLAEYLDESRCDDVLIRSSHVVAVDAPNEPWHRRYSPLMPANSLPVIRRHRRTRPGSGPRKPTACSDGADCVACR